MDLTLWLPGLFMLGVVSMLVCLAFAEACDRIWRSGIMIYVTAVITALLFIYLGTALVRPEWF